MRYLYKIYSNYDGFTPRRIPDRLRDGRYLRLGWARYLDSVDKYDECWVYFYGRHAFQHGVYIKGYISDIDRDQKNVTLRVRESHTSQPLTDKETSAKIAHVVDVKYRQVFLWPAEWNVIPECHLESCRQRLCNACHVWQEIPTIDPAHFHASPAMEDVPAAPAYWIIPSRCYLYAEGKKPALWTDQITHMFGEFKLGERDYAYPLALGMFSALTASGELEFDAIIPIPLSPDKQAAGELHRTRALSQELARLLGGAPIRECLSLSEPISKRRMLSDGHTLAQFRARYFAALRAQQAVSNLHKILLVDDVITRGTTLSCAIRRLREVNPTLEIVIVSAGQMIVKSAILDESAFVA